MSATDDPQPWPALSVPESIVWVDADGDGDLVLFDSDADTYRSLDPTAGYVWRNVADGDGTGEIVSTRKRRYGDDTAIVHDLQIFVEQAVALGLLAIREPVR